MLLLPFTKRDCGFCACAEFATSKARARHNIKLKYFIGINYGKAGKQSDMDLSLRNGNSSNYRTLPCLSAMLTIVFQTSNINNRVATIDGTRW
jgi:hypothetical protein